MTSTSTEPALVLDHVSKVFTSGWGSNKQRVGAVLDVSFRVEPNTVMGLVGESGSGKSTIGRMAVGLIEPTSGTIVAAGRDLSEVKGKELRLHRRKMQMVFQHVLPLATPGILTGTIIGLARALGETAHGRRIDVGAQLRKRESHPHAVAHG